jgi:hypothetical protein
MIHGQRASDVNHSMYVMTSPAERRTMKDGSSNFVFRAH